MLRPEPDARKWTLQAERIEPGLFSYSGISEDLRGNSGKRATGLAIQGTPLLCENDLTV